MYLKTIKSKGLQYLYLVDGKRDPSTKKIVETIVERYGRIDKIDPKVLDELKGKYKNGSLSEATKLREKHQDALCDLIKTVNSNAYHESTFNKAPQLCYGHLPLKQIWDKVLKLNYKINYLQKANTDINAYKLNNIAFAMVANKIINPSSYLKMYEKQSSYLDNPLSGICIDNIYASLRYLISFKDEIMEHVTKQYRAEFKLSKPKLVFFDCTNFYSETPYDDKEQFIRRFIKSSIKDLVSKKESYDEIESFLKSEHFAFKLECALQENEDSFIRMRGPSKEGRFSLPIVTLSLVIDENGVPIDFEVFSGNTSEFKTVKPCIKALKEKYGIENAYFVSDKGLNSTENLAKILEEDFGFIVSQKISNFNESMKQIMFDDTGWKSYQYDSSNNFVSSFISFNEDTNFKYKIADYIKSATVVDSATGAKKRINIKCKIMFSFSKERERYDLYAIEEQIAKAQKAVDKGQFMGNPYGSGWRALIVTKKESLSNKKDKEMYRAIGLDTKTIDKLKSLAGFSAVIYKDPKNSSTTIDERAVIDSYKSLVKIEECFRVMKHNFSIRPMYVRIDTHIKAHCLVCTLALIVLRILQIKLATIKAPMSSNAIANTLLDASVVMIGNEEAFINVGKYDDIYTKARCKASRTRSCINDTLDVDAIAEKYIRSKKENATSNLDNILKVCNLDPLPQLTTKNEIKKRLKIKNSLESIVDKGLLKIIMTSLQ